MRLEAPNYCCGPFGCASVLVCFCFVSYVGSFLCVFFFFFLAVDLFSWPSALGFSLFLHQKKKNIFETAKAGWNFGLAMDVRFEEAMKTIE